MSFPTDPTESYEGSIYGFGPFQSSGGSIVIPPAHPHRAGYGGSAYDGGVFSGSAYGMRAYGDVDITQVPHTAILPTIPFINQGYGGSKYGNNPYGLYAQSVPLTAYPTPSFNTVNSGFGGDPFGNYIYGSGILGGVPQVIVGGYGQSESGGGPYGDGSFPVSPFSVSGGYGGDPFGLSAYGSTEFISPYVASAISLNGYEIEVFFSEEMEETSNLIDPNTYELSSIIGGESEILSVRVGSRDGVDLAAGDFAGGVLSIIITHTGTMLGGTYKIRVVQPIFDLSGNSISTEEDIDDSLGKQPNEISLLTKGQAPTYSISVIDGKTLLVDFSENVLTEVEFPNGVENLSSYSFDDTIDYPVSLSVLSAEHYGKPTKNNQFDKVELTVQGMTSLTYNSKISDSTAFSYLGTTLPSEDTTFTATELGTGTSSAISFLSLSKSAGDVYGWRFEDTSGKLVAITSTYQFDLVIDASNTVFTPDSGTLATLTVDDGNIKIPISFQRVANIDYIDIDGLSVIQVDWSSAETSFTVLRNRKAQVYVFIVNGTPIASIPIVNFTTIGGITGAEFVLASAIEVLNFHLLSLTLNSSNTVYSKSWNFLHNVSSSFLGSAELTKNSFLTERGPLVKGWGDHTLATKKNVAVRVNNVAVEIESVNPYIGEINTVIPIPLMPIGAMAVEVDYEWFPTPKIELGGLNTKGSVLNKFDLRRERNTTSLEVTRGVADTSRFPMGLVLPFSERTEPLYIGHRYLGFEQGNTSSINSPTTFLLNQNPHSIAVDRFERDYVEALCTYEGEVSPVSEDWNVYGTDLGGLEIGQGTYEVKGNKVLYYKKEDLTFDSVTNLVARVQALSYTLNGIFTGIGFGFHNNHQMFFIGLLVHNDVQHIGLLKNSHRPDLLSSWELAFNIESEIIEKNKIRVTTSDLPVGLEVNNRFQIISGTQSGTYTISEIITDERFGKTTFIVLEDFPSDHTLYGNAYFKIVFEIDHSGDRNTYRLVSDHQERSIELYVSGDVSGFGLVVSEIDRVEPVYFDLNTSEQGEVFWGGLDPNATCSSSWSFFRYSVAPAENKKVSVGHRVFAELETLPQQNPNAEWFLEKNVGYSQINSGVLSLNTFEEYLYTRVEPFLTNKADVDVAIKIKSDFFTSTSTFAEIWDKNKAVELAFLCYLEPSSLFPKRRLTTIPFVKLVSSDLPYTKENNYSLLTNTLTFSTSALDVNNLEYVDTEERKVEIRFLPETYSFDSSGFSDFFFEVKLKQHTLYLYFTNTGISLSGDLSGVEYTFNWKDGDFHTYKIIYTSGNLSLSVDDVVLGSVSATTIANTVVTQSELVKYSQTSSSILFHSISMQAIPSLSVKKTLGVFLGGDRSDINSWELPRTDNSSNANSSSTDVVIQEIDWVNTFQEIRIHRDVTWGVTVLIDNLGSPPYFDGDYSTDITVPSAGWINVEYARLPRKVLNRNFGYVQFGGEGLSSHKVDWVRYRLFDHPYEDYRSPNQMVLNNFNIISSGETLVDTTPEILEIVSLDKNHILLSVSHIYSDFVYKIIVGNTIISENEWSFNHNTQLITVNDGVLTNDHQAVTVVCRINDKPSTTYLEKQPLLESVNLLNENTPSFAKSRLLDPIRTIKSGSPMGDTISSEGDPLTGITSTNHSAVGFDTSAEDLYESMSFVQVDNGGEEDLISSICDSPVAEHGFREIALSGRYLYDKANKVMPYPKFNQGGGFPSTFLFASGGSKQLGGNLNSVQTLTYPLASQGMQNRTFMVLRLSQSIAVSTEVIGVDVSTTTAPLVETITSPSTLNAPTQHSNSVNSPSVSTTNGGCHITIKQAGGVSRLGPFGGLSSLTPSGTQQISIGGSAIGSTYTTSSLLNVGIVLQGGSPLPEDFEHSQLLEQA